MDENDYYSLDSSLYGNNVFENGYFLSDKDILNFCELISILIFIWEIELIKVPDI